MPQFTKKTFPLGWIPSDDEHNGRYDGLLLTENCHLSDIGILRSFRGDRLVSDREFIDPKNLYSKIVKKSVPIPPPITFDCGVKPPFGTPLHEEGMLYSAITQAWAFNEGSGSVLNESRNNYTATINLSGAKWILNDLEAPALEINGGYEYPIVPHDATLITSGEDTGLYVIDPPHPTIFSIVEGPSNNIDTDIFSIFIRFKLNMTTSYNRARMFILGKGSDGEFPNFPFELRVYQDASRAFETWLMLTRFDESSTPSMLQQEGIDIPANFFDGEWHTLTIITDSYDTQGNWQFYFDNIWQDNNHYSGPEDNPFPSNDGFPLLLAGGTADMDYVDQPEHLGKPMWGAIDTIQIFNRELTELEVERLHYKPFLIWCPDCEQTLDEIHPLYSSINSVYPLNEGSGLPFESKTCTPSIIDFNGARWIGMDGRKMLEINGGYPFTTTPPTLEVWPNGEVRYPSSEIGWPSLGNLLSSRVINTLEPLSFTHLIRYKLRRDNNYNESGFVLSQLYFHNQWGFNIGTWQAEPFTTPVTTLILQYLVGSASGQLHYARWYLPLDGEWHTLVITNDGNSATSANAYLDGIKLTQFEQFAGDTLPATIPGAVRLIYNDLANKPLWGYVSTMQFYNRALTEEEVINLTADPYQIWLPSE